MTLELETLKIIYFNHDVFVQDQNERNVAGMNRQSLQFQTYPTLSFLFAGKKSKF